MVQWGSVSNCLTPLLSGGLNARAYCSTDPQSDKQASQKLCVGYLTGRWEELGALVSMLVASLLASAWQASPAFEVQDHFLNSMSAYYFLLINLSESRAKGSAQGAARFLPLPTCKLLLTLAGPLHISTYQRT